MPANALFSIKRLSLEFIREVIRRLLLEGRRLLNPIENDISPELFLERVEVGVPVEDELQPFDKLPRVGLELSEDPFMAPLDVARLNSPSDFEIKMSSFNAT